MLVWLWGELGKPLHRTPKLISLVVSRMDNTIVLHSSRYVGNTNDSSFLKSLIICFCGFADRA